MRKIDTVRNYFTVNIMNIFIRKRSKYMLEYVVHIAVKWKVFLL